MFINPKTLMLNRSIKVAVLGASGLIGKAIVKRFKQQHFVNILTPSHSELDLEKADEVSNYFRLTQPNLVILTAGKVGGILENQKYPADLIIKNLNIQLNVAMSAHESDCKKVVLLGSSCMYPKCAAQPMREIEIGTGSLESSSLSYAISKMAGLQVGFSYNLQYNLNRFLCVIPNSVYGPGDNFNPLQGHVLSALMQKFHKAKVARDSEVSVWGTGVPRREFVFSEDLADAILFLLDSDFDTINEPINIGSGADISISKLAELIAIEVGFIGEIKLETDKPDGALRKLLDSKKINDLGWSSSTKLKTGIAKTYEWYKKSIGYED